MNENGSEYQDPVVGKIALLVEPVLEDLGYELVEIQFRREQHGQVLRVIIFSKAGIGVGDCARVSREVSHLLDVEDLIDQAYSLEVSSPGLDRPLKSEKDFARYLGAKVGIVLADSAETLSGAIKGVDSQQVEISGDDGLVKVPLDLIKKAKLVIDF